MRKTRRKLLLSLSKILSRLITYIVKQLLYCFMRVVKSGLEFDTATEI